jgi:hypothetical protein
MYLLLDDQLTSDFMKSFLGYGKLISQCWFIGMEEGGGRSFENVSRRFLAWDDRGRRELEDLRDFHCQIGMPRLFGGRPPLQKTWSSLIRILLESKGMPSKRSKLREFQATKWGRISADHCLLDLLPLPSPSTNVWHYPLWSRLGFLCSRREYVQKMLPLRIERLRAKIELHQPTSVVFYGMKYRPPWRAIAGVNFEPVGDQRFQVAMKGRTLFLLVKHPAARGVDSHYFKMAGRLIMNGVPPRT